MFSQKMDAPEGQPRRCSEIYRPESDNSIFSKNMKTEQKELPVPDCLTDLPQSN